MNLSQLYEQELSFITNFITAKYKGKKKLDLKGFKEDLIKFYEVVSPDFLAFLEENVFSDKDNTKEFLEETLENGFMIEQKPFFNNITLEQMKYLYTEVFPVPKIKFENIEKPLVFGEIYYMKLKHLAHGKYSVRSAEMSNLLDVPYKNNEQYKKGTALFNANPLSRNSLLYLLWMILLLLKNSGHHIHLVVLLVKVCLKNFSLLIILMN